MTIRELKTVSPTSLKDINRLLKQLLHDPSTYVPVQTRTFREIAKNKNIVLAAAYEGARIIGIGMLLTVTKFRGRYGYIEDMMVDEEFRGRGYGEAIANYLVRVAKKRKIKTLELSTRPSRVPANNLYKKLGFEHKETNVYRTNL